MLKNFFKKNYIWLFLLAYCLKAHPIILPPHSHEPSYFPGVLPYASPNLSTIQVGTGLYTNIRHKTNKDSSFIQAAFIHNFQENIFIAGGSEWVSHVPEKNSLIIGYINTIEETDILDFYNISCSLGYVNNSEHKKTHFFYTGAGCELGLFDWLIIGAQELLFLNTKKSFFQTNMYIYADQPLRGLIGAIGIQFLTTNVRNSIQATLHLEIGLNLSSHNQPHAPAILVYSDQSLDNISTNTAPRLGISLSCSF